MCLWRAVSSNKLAEPTVKYVKKEEETASTPRPIRFFSTTPNSPSEIKTQHRARRGSWEAEQTISQPRFSESSRRSRVTHFVATSTEQRKQLTEEADRVLQVERGRCKLVNHSHCAFVFNEHLQRADKKKKKGSEFVATETIKVPIGTCERATHRDAVLWIHQRSRAVSRRKAHEFPWNSPRRLFVCVHKRRRRKNPSLFTNET